jgi:5-methylcytosine-specific restriction endonuclease McrA
LVESRKITDKKIKDKMFGPKKTRKTTRKTRKTKRRALAKAEETKVLKRQKYKCAICKMDISKLAVVNFDHKNPIALGGSNSLRNFQALCPTCHAEKTQQDRLAISRARRKRT